MYEINKGSNRFFMEENNDFIGEITYFENEKHHLVVNHTYVNPSYRGQKLAFRLVERMVAFAREEKKLIIPTCPYVLGLFELDDKFSDVWHKDPHDYEVACQIGRSQ